MKKYALLVITLLVGTLPAHSVTIPPIDGNAGDVMHWYFDICSGCHAAHGYSITLSSVVPSTPFESERGFTEYGGKLVQIKGGPFEYSRHLIDGQDVDTNGSTGWVRDSRVDFIGHVGMFSMLSGCYPGGCFSIGSFRGDGVTVFDNTLPVTSPTVP